jgi:hypothetical protein
MQRVEELALICVGRACGFAALGIATFMFALCTDPPVCFKAGGILTLMTSAILIVNARQALSTPYKRTELWLLLAPEERPLDTVAQTVIGAALQRTYLTFALHSALIAACLLAASLVVRSFHAVH